MAGARISDEEFASRRQAAAKRAADRGFDALLVWSRSGSSVGTYADVYYLTNFHSLFPLVTDNWRWASRGHSALILPVDGEPVLLTDYLDDPGDRVKVTDIRIVTDLTTGTVDVLKEMGLLDKKIGLVGRQSFLVSALRRMQEAAGNQWLNLEPADEILDDLRLIKSPGEMEHLRHAAAAGMKWMNATMGAVVEGNTEGDVVGAGLQVFAANGGKLEDVAIASGPNSANFFGSSGIPHWNVTRPLETGDLVHCDQWGPVDGYYTDFARSTVVGGKPDGGQRELLEGAVGIINHIIEGIEVDVTTFGDLYLRGQKWLDDNGFANHKSTGSEVGDVFSQQFPCFGHTIGAGMDGPWIIEGETSVVREDMALAIEALVSKPGVGAANHEENLIVQKDGIELLTAGCEQKRWA